MMGVVFFQKKVRKRYNAKYQNTYSNKYYVLKNNNMKYTRTRWKYSGRNKGKQVIFI